MWKSNISSLAARFPLPDDTHERTSCQQLRSQSSTPSLLLSSLLIRILHHNLLLRILASEHALLHSHVRPLRLILVLEQERQLLERAPVRLGEEEPDKDNLEREPDAVEDEVAPPLVGETDGVDKGREEVGQAAEELEEGDAARAQGVGPHLDEVGCGERLSVFDSAPAWTGVCL